MKWICFCWVLLNGPAASNAWSGVLVPDMITVEGEKVVLRAVTRGKVFRKGGELVEFFVDDASIGRTLSGGDGVAFKPYEPDKVGLREIRVTSGPDVDTGRLLTLQKGATLVFVDVWGALVEGPLSMEPKSGSQGAVKEINRSAPVVFLQRGVISVARIKEWLKDNGYPPLAVIPWRDGKVFEEMSEKELGIKAVIGGEAVIRSAAPYGAVAYSFSPLENTVWVKDWEEITAKMGKEGPKSEPHNKEALHTE